MHAVRTKPTRRIAPRGFTLVEVLVVVVIIAVAGAMVVPQMLKAGSMQVQAASRIVIADLLYAQNEAIAQQAPRRVVYDPTNNSYKLTDAAGTTMAATWKNDAAANYVVSFTDDTRFTGVTISAADFGGTKTIEFDALGAPSSGGTVDLISGTLHYRISVAAFTGRVTVAAVTGGG